MLEVLLGEVVNCPLVVIAWVRTRCFQHELGPQQLPSVTSCSLPKAVVIFKIRMGGFSPYFPDTSGRYVQHSSSSPLWKAEHRPAASLETVDLAHSSS